MTTPISIRRLHGFDDPSLGAAEWNKMLASGQTDVVFLTWHWQSAWWRSFGRGELLLLAAEREGQVVALAPLFADGGMVYFVGSGGSDYLDFIGDIREPGTLDTILVEAQKAVPNFIGFLFYHVPDQSDTGALLAASGARLGLKFFEEGDSPAPALELQANPTAASEALNKKSLVRHERFFTREGSLRVSHATRSEDILPDLDPFFQQHRDRWAATPYPSLFLDEAQRRFYRELTSTAAPAGWLRFTKLEWAGRSIAYHFGFCYRGSFLWYKPTFAIDLARRSPGEVLLRQLLLAALAENAHTFDFGLGDEAFKSRFATRVNRVRNWGLYHPAAVAPRATPTTTSAP